MWLKKVHLKTLGFIFFQLSSHTVQASWSTPTLISNTASDQPAISVDSSGNCVLIWKGFDGNNYVIQSSQLPFNGSWSTPITLSTSGQDAQSPHIAHDGNGNVVAVWSRYDGTSSIIQSAQLPINGSWTAPVNLSATGGNADSAVIAMEWEGSVGNAISVWHRYNGSNFVIQGATLPAGGGWSSAANISASGADALVPQVDVDSSGNSVITYIRYDGQNYNILSASQLYSQTWGPNFTLNVAGESTVDPTVTVNRSTGTAYVMWSQSNGNHNMIYFSTLVLGGSWSTPTPISDATLDSYVPYFVLDDSGNITAIWSSYNGEHFTLQSATLPVNGSWSTLTTLSDSTMNVGNTDVSVDPLGNVIVIWDIWDSSGNSKIQSAYLPFQGTWSDTTDLSPSGVNAYFADAGATDISSTGVVTAAWLQYDGNKYVVAAATYTP